MSPGKILQACHAHGVRRARERVIVRRNTVGEAPAVERAQQVAG
ncbi:MAG TPA: hypothetical protein VJR24_02785 [Gemmatimonadaceae bacterium]|nr:hypothetical protein [Gemmatimonadaceae bacterium]